MQSHMIPECTKIRKHILLCMYNFHVNACNWLSLVRCLYMSTSKQISFLVLPECICGYISLYGCMYEVYWRCVCYQVCQLGSSLWWSVMPVTKMLMSLRTLTRPHGMSSELSSLRVRKTSDISVWTWDISFEDAEFLYMYIYDCICNKVIY